MESSRTAALPSSLQIPVHEALKQLASEHIHEIGLGLSGGADSTALAVVLASLCPLYQIKPTFFHVHHGLFEQADRWLTLVQSLSQRLGVDCQYEHVVLLNTQHIGIEAAAREARYAALKRLAQAQGIQHIFLAHHLDDQAETVLYRLLRGAGISGSRGMLKRTVKETITYWRPWLDTPRPLIKQWIEAYASTEGLSIIEDPSNDDPTYARGYLRQSVLPNIRSVWPGYAHTLARHARLAGEAESLLSGYLQTELQKIQHEDDQRGLCLNLNHWATLDPIKQRWVLRHWLHTCGVQAPSEATLQNIQTQLLGDGATVAITVGSHVVRAYRRMAWLERIHADLNQSQRLPTRVCFSWDGQSSIDFPSLSGTLLIVEQRTGVVPEFLSSHSLSLGYRQGGERMKLSDNRPTQALKQICQSKGIPPYERDQLMVLSTETQAIFIAGIGVNMAVPHQSPGLGFQWLSDKNS